MPQKNLLTVAAVQMRFRPTVRENLAFIAQEIQRCGRAGADAVLFPECAVTGYNVDFEALDRKEVDQALTAIGRAAAQAGCHVLVGTPTYEGRRRYNSLVVWNRRGREVFRYHKIHLTPRDAKAFTPGNHLAYFALEGIPCTAIICHERRFPELVRLPVMMGARIVFHPNAGLDPLAVSKSKRGGRDGIATRAFENQVHYVFANSVGPQGDGLWSAGDSKIVSPGMEMLALADHRHEVTLMARLALAEAGRKYALEALRQPAFLRSHWRAMLRACQKQITERRAGSASKPPAVPVTSHRVSRGQDPAP